MGKNKRIARMRTDKGFRVKVWVNQTTGTIAPTNWKIQAGYLVGPSQKARK